MKIKNCQEKSLSEKPERLNVSLFEGKER